MAGIGGWDASTENGAGGPAPRIGVVGGLGPQATSDFYLALLDRWQRILPGTSADVVMHSVALPDGLPRVFIDGDPSPAEVRVLLKLVLSSIQLLERSEAQLVAIPCNTIHCYVSALRHHGGPPIIDLVEATVATVASLGASRVGVLSGRVTRKQHVYPREAMRQGLSIEFVYPAARDQDRLEGLLASFVNGDDARDELLDATCELSQQLLRSADLVLLACTDLCFAIEWLSKNRVVSTVECLADEVVQAALGLARNGPAIATA